MDPTTNRAKQAQKTKHKIFETGIKLIRAKGFESVNIQDIVKEASVSIGTFYHYYNSKIDLFMDLYRNADDLFENTVAPKVAGKNGKESILIFFDEYCSLVMNDGINLVKNIFVPDNDIFLNEPRAMHELLLKITDGDEQLRDELFLIARGVVFDWALRDGGYDLKEKMEAMLLTYLQ